jgi:hypothetical protein
MPVVPLGDQGFVYPGKQGDATVEAAPDVLLGDIVTAFSNARRDSGNCEVGGRHFDEMENGAISDGSPVSNSSDVGF